MLTHPYNVVPKHTEAMVITVMGSLLIHTHVLLYLQSLRVTRVPMRRVGVLSIVLKRSVCIPRWVPQVCVAFFDRRSSKSGGRLRVTRWLVGSYGCVVNGILSSR